MNFFLLKKSNLWWFISYVGLLSAFHFFFKLLNRKMIRRLWILSGSCRLRKTNRWRYKCWEETVDCDWSCRVANSWTKWYNKSSIRNKKIKNSILDTCCRTGTSFSFLNVLVQLYGRSSASGGWQYFLLPTFFFFLDSFLALPACITSPFPSRQCCSVPSTVMLVCQTGEAFLLHLISLRIFVVHLCNGVASEIYYKNCFCFSRTHAGPSQKYDSCCLFLIWLKMLQFMIACPSNCDVDFSVAICGAFLERDS